MANYIEIRLLEATPAAMRDGQIYLEGGAAILDVSSPTEEGYAVTYADGGGSWIPKDVFEKHCMEVIPNAGLKTKISISTQMVDDFVKEVYVSTLGEKTTLVRAVCVNGFEICETSSCVDAANYEEKIGAEICLDNIEDKLWALLGFLLQTAVGGVKL